MHVSVNREEAAQSFYAILNLHNIKLRFNMERDSFISLKQPQNGEITSFVYRNSKFTYWKKHLKTKQSSITLAQNAILNYSYAVAGEIP